MALPFSAGRLPVELLSMIADCLDIQDLLALSHVCARWCAVARANPTFWQTIRLAALSDSAFEFFHARLETAAERRVNLELCLERYPLCDRIKNVVLPAVTRSLCHAVHLILDMHTTTASRFISVLLNPAPILESMGLRVFHHPKSKPILVLPSNLLTGTCPRFVSLSLANVGLPNEPISAFQRVHSMVYHFGRRRIIHAGMFSHFPALRNLTILGHSPLRVESSDGPAPISTVLPLDELRLSFTRCDYDRILSSFPNVASAKHVVCFQPSANVAQQLVDQLRGGPLELTFCHHLRDDLIHISLYELPTDRMRSLAEHEESVAEDMPRGVLFAPSQLARYETLRLSSQLGYLAPHIEALPRCHTLEIILNSHRESRFPTAAISAPLRLPELRTVVVWNGQEHPTRTIAVDAERLRTYLSQLLGVRPTRPSLRLHGVAVKGDNEALFGDYEKALN